MTSARLVFHGLITQRHYSRHTVSSVSALNPKRDGGHWQARAGHHHPLLFGDRRETLLKCTFAKKKPQNTPTDVAAANVHFAMTKLTEKPFGGSFPLTKSTLEQQNCLLTLQRQMFAVAKTWCRLEALTRLQCKICSKICNCDRQPFRLSLQSLFCQSFCKPASRLRSRLQKLSHCR